MKRIWGAALCVAIVAGVAGLELGGERAVGR